MQAVTERAIKMHSEDEKGIIEAHMEMTKVQIRSMGEMVRALARMMARP